MKGTSTHLARVHGNENDLPIRVDIRLRNNLLVALRERSGLSAGELAERIGISYGEYLRLEAMTRSPMRKKDGEWRPAALKVATYWKMLPEDLFPDVVCRIQKTRGSFSVDERQMQQLGARTRNTAPCLPEEAMDDAIEARNLRENLQAIFARELIWYEVEIRRLKTVGTGVKRDIAASIKHYERRMEFIKRDAEMLLFHFGFIDGDTDHTLIETAQRYGITTTRVMHIVNMWIMKLKTGRRRALIAGDPEPFAESFGYLR